jgi:hypothetical protein
MFITFTLSTNLAHQTICTITKALDQEHYNASMLQLTLCCNTYIVATTYTECCNTSLATCLRLQHTYVAMHLCCNMSLCCNTSLSIICLLLQHTFGVESFLLQHITLTWNNNVYSHLMYSYITLNAHRTRALILPMGYHNFQYDLPQTHVVAYPYHTTQFSIGFSHSRKTLTHT